jgi:signal transduction histidine kinase
VHQLRNPLAALRTYAQLLLRRLEADSSHRALVEGMLSEQRQIGQYIDVLDGLGQKRLPQQEPLGPTLLPPGPAEGEATMQTLLMPLLERAEATASLQGRPWQGPDLWPQWIHQPSQDGTIAEIVANLLENAFRYSPAGCIVGLCLLPDGLCVWDDGPPIPLEERDLIFERGARGSTGQDRAGTGLGLALARSLAEQQGRNLTLCVEPSKIAPDLPTQGNAFVLNWPAEARPNPTT